MCLLKITFLVIGGEVVDWLDKQARFSITKELKSVRVTPIHKKGDRNMVDILRLVSNLTSLSKLFEKLVLNSIEQENKWYGR